MPRESITGPSLFDAAESRRRAARGIDRAFSSAEEPWKIEGRAVLRDLARTSPEFTSDDFWALLEPRLGDQVYRVKRDAAGGLFREAARDGLIARTERWIPSSRASAHSQPKRVWRSLL